MAGRKTEPQLAPQSKGRRMIELVKDLLILVLTLSAVFLAGQTPIFTELRGRITPSPQVSAPPVEQSEGGVVPYFLCVQNDLGLYGAGYDQGQIDGVFEALSPLLAQGLTTAQTPERIGRYQWRGLLSSPGVTCVFQGRPPMNVLCAWLCDTQNSVLTGNVRMLTLARSAGQVWLAWEDEEGLLFRSSTQVDSGAALDDLLGDYNPNGVAYAFVLAGSDEAYSSMDPSLPVPMDTPQPLVYTVSAPDPVHENDTLETLLSALGFRSGVGSTYESGGALALNENGDRLRLSPDGSVTFRGGEEPRYPVEDSSAAGAAQAAWELLNRATAPWRGEAIYVLTEVEPIGEAGWTVTFHTRLDGIPVLTGESGSSAVFTVTEGAVTDFTLTLRTYTATGETALLPSPRLAAAALRSLADSDGSLLLSYTDTGSGTMWADWMSNRK